MIETGQIVKFEPVMLPGQICGYEFNINFKWTI